MTDDAQLEYIEEDEDAGDDVEQDEGPAVDDADVRAKPTAHSKRDPEVEAILKEFGLNFIYRDGLIASDFDDNASLNNQSRFGGLKPDAVNRYWRAILRGDVLPAGVHRVGARRKKVMVSGNHRRKSFDKAHEPFASYELTDTDIPRARLQELTTRLNRDHGEPLGESDRVANAVHQVYTMRVTVAQAASENGVSAHKVTSAKAKQDAIIRAANVGIKTEQWKKIPPSTGALLATVHTDEGFRALTQLTLDFALPKGTVDEILKQIQINKSSKQQVDKVEAIRNSPEFQRRARQGGNRFNDKRGQHTTPRTAAARTLSLIESFPAATLLAQYYPTPEDRREMAKEIERSIKKLDDTRKALLDG